jgi:hypothetical protein
MSSDFARRQAKLTREHTMLARRLMELTRDTIAYRTYEQSRDLIIELE